MSKKAYKSSGTMKTVPALDLKRTVACGLFSCRQRPWEALYSLHGYIRELGPELPHEQYDEISENVWMHISAYLAPTARIEAPSIICGGAQIRHGAYIHGSVVGAFSTIGEHACVRDSIIFDRAVLCGQSRVSVSVLGYEATIGDGSVLSDRCLDGSNVLFDMPEGIYISGKKNLGSVICDGAHIGALCVVDSGAVVGECAQVSPLSRAHGYIPPFS